MVLNYIISIENVGYGTYSTYKSGLSLEITAKR